MVTGLGPGFVIQAPPITPAPLGLLDAAPVIDHTDQDLEWMNGVLFQGDDCSNAVTFDPCSTTSGDVTTTFTDAATTNGSPTLTSATAAFVQSDIGAVITGAGIPTGTTIQSVTNATTVVLSQNATATATGVTINIIGRAPASRRQPTRQGLPFGVEAWDTCSAFGFEQADYEGRARRALAARESKAVEYELATGVRSLVTNNGNVRFQDPTNTIQYGGGSAQGVRNSLAVAVQAAADYNLGQAMIHARPFIVALWSSQNMLRVDNAGKLFTYTGHRVVPGAGYTGASPSSAAPTSTSEWVYVTSVIQPHRSPVEVFASEQDRAASFNRTNNTFSVRAQRLYALALNACPIVGINVNPTT